MRRFPNRYTGDTTAAGLTQARRFRAGGQGRARLNQYSNMEASVVMADSLRCAVCPPPPAPAPPPPAVCVPDYSDLCGQGILMTRYSSGNGFLDPIPLMAADPFNVCVYPWVFTMTAVLAGSSGTLVPGGATPADVWRFCMTVVPLVPMNAIRLGFAADDGVALRLAPAGPVLASRWSVAAPPSLGGVYVYSEEFSIGCQRTAFEIVSANSIVPNDYYELSIFWIWSPGPAATQAELDAAPKLGLKELCYWVPCPLVC